jgi:hypothetical protein
MNEWVLRILREKIINGWKDKIHDDYIPSNQTRPPISRQPHNTQPTYYLYCRERERK